MGDPLFDTERCDVPSVQVTDFDFVQDCLILPAPSAITSCDPVEIAIDPPPIDVPSTICTTLSATANMEVQPGAPTVDIVVTQLVNEPGSSCAFGIDFNFTLPVSP